MTQEVKNKIEEEAQRYSTNIVKGPTEWEQKDPSKKKHFIKAASFGYSLASEEIERLKAEVKLLSKSLKDCYKAK